MTKNEFDVWDAAMDVLGMAQDDDLPKALKALEAEVGSHLVVGIQGPGVRILLARASEDTTQLGRFFRGGKGAAKFLED